MINMLLEIVSKILHATAQGLNGSRCQGAEGLAYPHKTAEFLQLVDVVLSAQAVFYAAEDLHRPGQTVTARGTPSAAFLGKKL